MVQEDKGWIDSLSERRFFRYIITYIAVSWGIVQAVDWAVKRYDLSHGLVDGALLFFVVLLPGILLFTYNHGTPGADQWTKTEKFVLPVNLLAALGIGAFAVTSGAQAAPVTETVTITNEAGEEEERVVFNQSLLKRVMVFPAVFEEDPEANKWKSLAIADLQEADLENDPRITALGPLTIANILNHEGRSVFDELSLSVRRVVAEDRYVDYFVVPNVSFENDSYTIKYVVYKTDTGKEVLEKEYTDADIYSIIDRFSEDCDEFLYKGIDDLDEAKVTFVDMPSRDLRTDDFDLFEKSIRANYVTNIENNPQEGLKLLNEVIDADPNYAMAYQGRANIYAGIQKLDQAGSDINTAIDKALGLPEKTLLRLKLLKYMYANDINKAQRLGEMWSQLYPQDPDSYRYLDLIYSMSGILGKRIEVWEQGYQSGHKGTFLLKLGELYTQNQEYEKAEKYLAEFQQLYPSKQGEVKQLGDLYLKQGKFNEAISYFEDVILKDDQKAVNYINAAGAYLKKGDFERTLDAYDDALEISKSPTDSLTVYASKSAVYYLTGESEKFLQADGAKFELVQKVYPPVMYGNIYNLRVIAMFNECGYLDMVRDKMEEIKDGVPNNTAVNFTCLMDYNFALGAKDLELLEKSMITCPDDISNGVGPVQRIAIDGLIASIRGDHLTAFGKYKEFAAAAQQPESVMYPALAEASFEMGKHKEAVKYADGFIDLDRSNAEIYFVKAKALAALGKKKQAKEALDQALSIWKDADDIFTPAQEAREFAASL